MASLSPLAGLKTTGLEDDEIHCENFFKDDPTTLQKLNNFRSIMVDKMKSIKNKLIVKYPKVFGIVDNRLEDHHKFKWLLQPMVVMASGQPITKGRNGVEM